MTGANFRGPPVPLLLVPIVAQLVRASYDPRMTTYLKELSKGGPVAIAENAHKIVQYALSKVPSSVLYWFASTVLALPPGTAMQTTEFLKSRSDFEILMGRDDPVLRIESTPKTVCRSSDEVVSRLEKLEMEYRLLQEHHDKSLKNLTYNPDNLEIPVSA